jgi:hypothetical protein
MLLAGSLAVIGKEKSSLKLENLVKPECDRNRGGDCRFFGTSSSFLAWRVPSFAIGKDCCEFYVGTIMQVAPAFSSI